MKDYQSAILDCNKAIEINPQYRDAFIVRGSAKSLIGNYQGAMADYGKAMLINQ